MKLTIVDYGLGNLWSVRNALEHLGVDVEIAADPDRVRNAESLILPGVGSFGTGMSNLRETGLYDSINEAVVSNGRPLLGICLGMQLLGDVSEEAPTARGLGWIPGPVRRLQCQSLRLPHMGFNSVIPVQRQDPAFNHDEGFSDFYFVHSFHFSPDDEKDRWATTEYGGRFTSAVRREHVWGVQFHPEKSQSNGLKFLSHFIEFCRSY